MTKNTRLKIIIISVAVLLAFALCGVGLYIFRDSFIEEDIVANTLEDGGIVLHFIDVGQADCILIMTPQGNMLIDAGTNSSEAQLKSYLYELEIKSFEYLVLTHSHDDHIGGADMIVKEFDVENVIMTDSDEDIEIYLTLLSLIQDRDINVIEAVSGESFSLGDFKSTILAPNKEYEEYDEVNSTSVVLKCEFGECSVILTGDAETDSEAEMIERYGEFLDCDILKLGHHGSKTSSSYEFLEITSPDYAIACCGTDNTYGHPAAEVVYRLNLFGIQLIRTDKEGSIVFICNGEKFEYVD